MSDLDASKFWLDALKWDESGMIPAIAQDAASGRVVMFAWMNRTSLEETVKSGNAVYWSRSRQEYWRKGDTSGHAQFVRSVALDCDGDALLVRVEQIGAACHRGAPTCFAGGELPARSDLRPSDVERGSAA